MELALMWMELVAAALLVIAVAVAQAARGPKALGTALVTLVGLLLALATLPVSLLFAFAYVTPPASLLVLVLPALAVLACAAALAAWGRTSPAPGLASRAAGWPRARLGVALLAVVVVLGTSARNVLLSSEQAIASRRAALLSLERLWWPGVPPSLNAAPLYAQAARQLVPLDAVPGAHAAFEALWGAEVPTAAQVEAKVLSDWTLRNAGALALAIEGTGRPGFASVESSLWQGNRLATGREGKILRLEANRAGRDPSAVDAGVSRRRLGDLLQTRALQRAHAGQRGLAVQDANALLALAEQTHAPQLEPERLIERLLGAPGMTAADLAALRFPQGEGLDVRLQRTLLRGEQGALEGLGLFTTRSRGQDPLDVLLLGLGVFRVAAWGEEIERAYDELWEALYAPPAQRLARIRAVGAWPSFNAIGWHTLDRWLVEALEAGLRAEARRLCAEVGVAVERSRLEHGRWPESLADLVPGSFAQVPLDPFDGAPLRYRAGADAALVYSVGANLKDDGGDRRSTDQGPGDLVFKVPAPR